MKTILKYISLLIFSGLIIPFYYQFKGVDAVVKSNCVGRIATHPSTADNLLVTFRIIKELAKNFTPVLKSENNL
ncbi:hypothetical protein [Mucilaginibacter celer]|uniref:Uncharacterized protein n=1 Tax=Mucilaginibacter celer TaxID=2305508 RepID=A0A494W528_9SPHI|nr:hypothetical protein [Mucilaginibacter celer]AYL98402.1 hypothetical protein HYN43_025325 [Mucilaginibacter celer]